MPAPVLSVLIPAYNYVAGVDRVLGRRGRPDGSVEYVVHDDSTDDAVAALMASCQDQNVIYRRNARPGGAVSNWNGLLERATGEFVVLLHHDEFPAREGLFEDLAAHLADDHSRGTNVWLLGLRRLRRSWPLTDQLVPDSLRFWLLRRFPHYLATRNFVGPSASFVVRRQICPRFDENLKWLVDVDFYLRTLERSGEPKGLGNFCIVSEVDRRESITRSLGSDIGAIRAREMATIAVHAARIGGQRRQLPAMVEKVLWLCARAAGALCLGGRYDA